MQSHITAHISIFSSTKLKPQYERRPYHSKHYRAINKLARRNNPGYNMTHSFNRCPWSHDSIFNVSRQTPVTLWPHNRLTGLLRRMGLSFQNKPTSFFRFACFQPGKLANSSRLIPTTSCSTQWNTGKYEDKHDGFVFLDANCRIFDH